MNIQKWGILHWPVDYFDNYKSDDVFNLFFYRFVLISLKVNLHRTFRPQTKFKQESFAIVQIMAVNDLS